MDKKFIGLLVVIGVIVLYLVSWLIQIKYRDDEYGLDLIGGSRGNKMVELFDSKPAPLTYGMGPLSNINIKLRSGNHFIRKDKPLIQSNNIYVPSGTPLPLEPRISSMGSTNGTNVDGTVNTPKSMAMFKYNKCVPECCPSTYSCSGGCVCQSDKQADFINKRGNNRTTPSEY